MLWIQTYFSSYLLIVSSGSLLWIKFIIFCRDTGLFCRDTGLFCRDTSLTILKDSQRASLSFVYDARCFCRDTGLFCRDTGLFCRDTGLVCRDTGLFCDHRDTSLTVLRHSLVATHWDECLTSVSWDTRLYHSWDTRETRVSWDTRLKTLDDRFTRLERLTETSVSRVSLETLVSRLDWFMLLWLLPKK